MSRLEDFDADVVALLLLLPRADFSIVFDLLVLELFRREWLLLRPRFLLLLLLLELDLLLRGGLVRLVG